MRLFWEHGYEQTSIADLTLELGISATSLYAAFGDKQTLFEEAVDRYEASPESVTTVGLAGTNPHEVVATMLEGAAREYTSAAHPRGCLVNSEPRLGNNRAQNRALTASLGGLGIDRDGWAAQAQGSDAALTELADALARLPGGDFRSAHAQAQTLMRSLAAQGRDLASATDADLDALGVPVPPGTAAAALDARRFVERRTTLGGPASGTVRTHLTFAAERLKSDQERHLALGVRFSRTRLLETHL